MSVAGFFIILAISIILRYIGNKLVPLVMPTGRLKVIIVGWVGGFVGSILDKTFWQLGPVVAEISIAAAAIGCAVFIVILGIAPFIKIMLGKI